MSMAEMVTAQLAIVRQARAERNVREASLPGQKFVVRRPFTFDGRHYRAGESVRLAKMLPHKIAQLVNQRMLSAPLPPMMAARVFSLGDRSFKIGDPFPLQGLRPEKVTQLLEYRYIQPQAVA